MVDKTQLFFKRLWGVKQWSSVIPTISVILVILTVPSYLLLVRYGGINASSSSSSSPSSVSKIKQGLANQPNVRSSSPPTQSNGKSTVKSAQTSVLGSSFSATRSNRGVIDPGSNESASADSRQLVISPVEATISTTSITPNIKFSAANHAKIHQPILSGPKDIQSLFLKVGGEQYAYDDWVGTVFRAHPDGSGVAHFTVTALDEAGNKYTGSLTVNWPPIPYFFITNTHVDIGPGIDSLGDSALAVNVHFTLAPGPNFGSHYLRMVLNMPWPYQCDGAVGLGQQVTYDGSQNNYTLSCVLPSYFESTYRVAHGLAAIVINTDIFTRFNPVAQDVQIPIW